MKLISCYIKNFGNLSDKEFSFEEGLNVFVEENGYGKSTLSSFVKAMLFGLEGVRDNDKDFKDRKHYAPFNGMPFGGTLVLEHKGKEYRIEKLFDVKSVTKDITTIYVDGEKTNFDNEIGVVLLGLDRESFDRLLFITSKDIKMESNGTIKKNLSGIISDTTEGYNFEEIMEKLSEVKKKYGSSKTSDLSSKKLKKDALETTIKNQETIIATLKGLYEDINLKKQQLHDLNNKQQLYNDQAIISEYWDTYNSKLKDIADKKEQLKHLMENYQQGYPNDDELNNLKQLFTNRNNYIATLNALTFSKEDEAQLEAFRVAFLNGVPEENLVSAIEEKIKKFNELNLTLNGGDYSLSEEEIKIFNKFNEKPVEEDRETIKKLLDDYKTIDQAMSGVNKYEDQPNDVPNHSKNKLLIIIAAVSAALLVAGIPFMFFLLVLGIVFVALGALGLLAAGFLYLKGRIDANNGGVARTSQEYESLKNQLMDKSHSIYGYLTKYVLYTGNVYVDAQNFENDYARYREICAKMAKNDDSYSKNNTELATLKTEIDSFLIKYVKYDSFDNGIATLKQNIFKYTQLLKSYESYVSKKKQTTINIESINNAIKGIGDKYHLDLASISLEKLISDSLLIESLNKDIKKMTIDAKNYRTEKGLTEEISTDGLADYKDEIIELTKDIVRLGREIDQAELEVADYEDNKQKLAECKAEIKLYEKRFKMLSILESALRDSQSVLDDKYVAPVMDGFKHYSKMLGDVLGVKIKMGRDFDITLDIGGQYKSDEHLSGGQRSICALCFRLALLDNLFKEEAPFIIMDDPFAALDEKNMLAMSKAIKNLSKNKQIIYLTCHSSRNIK